MNRNTVIFWVAVLPVIPILAWLGKRYAPHAFDKPAPADDAGLPINYTRNSDGQMGSYPGGNRSSH